ncbi:B3/4 domain-containing protein [Erwinia sp. MMLR14_017]|uniref:B3/B4 domain-containing protein n=1 Tax=Erwinia sp. MMLR14_017 TaxID=3093842 RepID=UPI0029901862|nr:B3/4 domain-containing protein [Erwinia sp. MMLR14_017]MDW8846611.1 B3/4 domain-containing protein [Erwinia sp. MMLR14_017]
MFIVHPSIAPSIADIAPGFRALSIVVEAAPVTHPEVGSQALMKACGSVKTGEPAWADAHLESWAEVFRKFGAKPKRTPCSAEALRKRILRDGNMAGIDPVVDLYNAISIAYAVPVGGENMAAYSGAPRLVVAEGNEVFDTMKEGQPSHESPEPGEVVWRDDMGVTCRRWNWRQGVRTRLSAQDKQMWFILESLPEMPLAKLIEAGEKLTEGLEAMMPGSVITQELVGFGINKE